VSHLWCARLSKESRSASHPIRGQERTVSSNFSPVTESLACMLRPLARQAHEGRETAAERRVVLKEPATVEGEKAPADAAIATTMRTFLSILSCPLF
jgi:hypothetical protein